MRLSQAANKSVMPAAMPDHVHAAPESWGVAFSVTLILVFTAIVYLRGWLRLPLGYLNFIPAWRAVSFCLGLFLTWIAAASPVATFDGKMLTAHMVQHLLLMTFAPPLIWFGAPMLPLLYGLPPLRSMSRWPLVAQRARTRAPRRGKKPAVLCGARVTRWPFCATSLMPHIRAVLGHPVLCWLAAAITLVVWHVPALFNLGMKSQIWHLTEHMTFFATGLLFWWPVMQPWPSVSRWPPWSMLLYLFLATLPCDVLSGLLVFSDRIAYPMYLSMPRQTSLSVLEDQQCAGALMWTCVTVVFLVAGTVLSMHLLSPQKCAETGKA
jgi:putative membrane protein